MSLFWTANSCSHFVATRQCVPSLVPFSSIPAEADDVCVWPWHGLELSTSALTFPLAFLWLLSSHHISPQPPSERTSLHLLFPSLANWGQSTFPAHSPIISERELLPQALSRFRWFPIQHRCDEMLRVSNCARIHFFSCPLHDPGFVTELRSENKDSKFTGMFPYTEFHRSDMMIKRKSLGEKRHWVTYFWQELESGMLRNLYC